MRVCKRTPQRYASQSVTTWLWNRKPDGTRQSSAEVIAAHANPTPSISFLQASASQLAESGVNNIQSLVVFVTEEQAAEQVVFPSSFLPTPAFEKLLPLPLVLPQASLQDFAGKLKETQFVYPSYEGPGLIPRVLLVGVGKAKEVSVDKMRSAMHSSLAALRAKKFNTAAVMVPKFLMNGGGQKEMVDALARTAVLSNHTFDKYLSGDNAPNPIEKLILLTSDLHDPPSSSSTTPSTSASAPTSNKMDDVLKTAQAVAECTVFAREMANDRADSINPKTMEALAKNVATAHKLKFTSITDSKLKAAGYNLLPAVGQGAVHPARLVTIEYNGNPDSKETLALVGKGITFDTGGLNLKPTGFIESMHLDMSGSAAVLASIKAAAILNLKVNVVAVLALAENAIGEKAVKPHTIIQTPKGSVEINNTDAEGRLALADALMYTQSKFAPTRIIDVATLTGACVVALGEYAAGVFSNNDALAMSLMESGQKTYERCWRLPILPEHTEELKGQYSDMRSTGKDRAGGACTAAAFLQKFIDEGVHWAHVDIAGPAMYSSARDFMPAGGTGFGVQLLVDYMQKIAKP